VSVYDHPVREWLYRVTRFRDGVVFVWARSSGAARYKAAKERHPNNAIWYAGGYRAERAKP
jgi:hypothetical protein